MRRTTHSRPLELSSQESHELSQEIDDVLGLLQSMKSKDEKAEASQFLWATKRERTFVAVYKGFPQSSEFLCGFIALALPKQSSTVSPVPKDELLGWWRIVVKRLLWYGGRYFSHFVSNPWISALGRGGVSVGSATMFLARCSCFITPFWRSPQGRGKSRVTDWRAWPAASCSEKVLCNQADSQEVWL